MSDYSHPAASFQPGQALEIVDEQFLTVRTKLLDVAAVLDRIDRAATPADATALDGDARLQQIRLAIEQLLEAGPGRAERVQMIFSLPWPDEPVG